MHVSNSNHLSTLLDGFGSRKPVPASWNPHPFFRTAQSVFSSSVFSSVQFSVQYCTVHHNYYQWVGILLVIQACICYLPWAWWKDVERGRVAKLVEKISKDPLTETPLGDQVVELGNFLSNNSRWFNSCAVNLLMSQCMCLIRQNCDISRQPIHRK